MWFKNLQLFDLDEDWTLTPGTLEEILARHALQPCPALSQESSGWVAPTGQPALVQGLDRHLLIALGTEQKLLPASVINDAAKARAEAWERERGFKPGRKLLREFRERAASELLPRAFVRRRVTRAWIDPSVGRIIVDAASPARAEALIEKLRDALGEFSVSLPQTPVAPSATMTEWLARDLTPGRFVPGEECELSGKEDSRPVVRYLRQPLQTAQLRRHFDEGFRVSRLALVWNSRVSLLLNDKLQLRRVAFLDIGEVQPAEAQKDPEREFETNFALMTGEYSAMIGELLEALGATRLESALAE